MLAHRYCKIQLYKKEWKVHIFLKTTTDMNKKVENLMIYYAIKRKE